MNMRERKYYYLMKMNQMKGKALKLIVGVGLILVIVAVATLPNNDVKADEKTTKIGFEDIGELDTQVAYCTVVDVLEDPEPFLGSDMFKSKCVYSYDVVVKAGLNFQDIEWKQSGDKIKVKMPAIGITDSYPDHESGKVYHEEKKLFSKISFEEQMQATDNVVKMGEKDAIENGLLDNAKENAETMITSFFKQHNEYRDLEIVFEWEA